MLLRGSRWANGDLPDDPTVDHVTYILKAIHISDAADRFLLAPVAATLAPVLGLPSTAPHALDRAVEPPAKPLVRV
jgi:hypothetical protein